MVLPQHVATMAERAVKLDYFSRVGQPLPEDVERPSDWDAAVRNLLKKNWVMYGLAARNEMSGFLFTSAPQKYQQWNDVLREVNGILGDGFQGRISLLIPVCGKRRDVAAEEVLLMVRLACIEQYYSELYAGRFYSSLFGWLERGHLPCGVRGRFPDGVLRVW